MNDMSNPVGIETVSHQFNARIIRIKEIDGQPTYSNNMQNGVEIWFEYTTKDYPNPLYRFEDASWATSEMPWIWFSEFMHKTGYLGPRDPAKLFAKDGPMLGHQFLVRLGNMICDGPFDYRPASGGVAIEWLSCEHMHYGEEGIPKDFNVEKVLDAVRPDGSILYHDNVTTQELETAGWVVRYREHDERTKCPAHILDFERRRAIFAGEKWSWNKSRWINGTGKRSLLLTYTQHRLSLKTEIVFMTQAVEPAVHIHTPIWQGDPFWSHPRTDSDVARIVQDCKRKSMPAPPLDTVFHK